MPYPAVNGWAIFDIRYANQKILDIKPKMSYILYYRVLQIVSILLEKEK